MGGGEDNAQRLGLAEFLKRNRGRALLQWEEGIRKLPPASRLDLAGVRDNIPALLDRIIDEVEGRPVGSPNAIPDEHARVRLDQGFSLEEIAEEYRILRSALFRQLVAEPAPLEPERLLQLNEVIDHALARALSSYHRRRSRSLMALERISQEAFATYHENLRDFLRRFLNIIIESADDADAAVIYLREWDRLVVRAAAGTEAPPEDQHAVRIGEGIAGIVATRRPYFTASVADDPNVAAPSLRAAGLKALYAVPLVCGDDLIGVAKMASRTAVEFSDEDRQLFEEIAQRAAILITHRRLAEEREVFIGVLGHDLRSPLHTIALGAAYLRKTQNLTEAALRAVQRMVSAAQRMERMLGDLADYTKLRFGAGLSIEPHVMDLGEALRQLVEELRTQNPNRTLQLEVNGDAVGEWDRVRLGQVVSNLVHNAVAYGDPSSPITIAADGTEEGSVTLRVHNVGPPIAPGLIPSVFDAFRRGRPQGAGMGLGLYIVKHVAQAHRGSVDVESTAEEGTTFTVRLPRWS